MSSEARFKLRIARLLVVLVLMCTGTGTALSQSQASQDRELILNRSVNLDFSPIDGFFLVEGDGRQIERVKAVLMPYSAASGLVAGTKNRWLVGARLTLPASVVSLRVSLVLIGRNNRFEFFAALPMDLETTDTFGGSTDLLKARLLQRRKVLDGLDAQQNKQQQSLRRLQDDADVIGNIGRIVDVQDEAAKLHSDIEGLELDIQRLKQFFTLASSQPTPRSQLRREAELTASLTELSDASRQAELGAAGHRNEAEGELRRKLEAIESTRYDDAASLQQQLIELRKRRMQLEKQTGIVSDAPQGLGGGEKR